MRAYLLSLITQLVPKDQVGLYRDDGLMVTPARPRQADILRKKLEELFRREDLSIEAHANLKIVDFLDVQFNLSQNSYKPFMKPGNTPRYVHIHSDHPKQILNNLPLGVQRRLSTISSSKEEFDAAAPPYQAALAAAGHGHRLKYDETAGAGAGATGAGAGAAPPRGNRRRRRRNITYFCPPFFRILETKLGNQFLRAIDESFPVGNELHGKINRHNIKLSYSCMPNMKKRIGRHN